MVITTVSPTRRSSTGTLGPRAQSNGRFRPRYCDVILSRLRKALSLLFRPQCDERREFCPVGVEKSKSRPAPSRHVLSVWPRKAEVWAVLWRSALDTSAVPLGAKEARDRSEKKASQANPGLQQGPERISFGLRDREVFSFVAAEKVSLPSRSSGWVTVSVKASCSVNRKTVFLLGTDCNRKV